MTSPSAMHCRPLAYDRSHTLPPITTFDELVGFLDPRSPLPSRQQGGRPPFPALGLAIAAYERHFEVHFYTALLPRILHWASHPPTTYSTVTGLHFDAAPTRSSCGRYDRTTCRVDSHVARYVLANMLLLNTPTSAAGAGTLDLARLLQSQTQSRDGNVGVARVLCLLAYFHRHVMHPDDDVPPRVIVLERREWCVDVPLDAMVGPLVPLRPMLSSMESSPAHHFVDFANRDLHIHSIIPSATQEEVLFSCAPEAFLAIGLCPRLADNQVVVLHNMERVCDYEGYLDSFAFAKLLPAPRIMTILAIDAVTSHHFSLPSVERDVRKAMLAFLDDGICYQDQQQIRDGVVTGHWGCGVFGGNKTHKLLQQWVAASLANVPWVDYSVFQDAPLLATWSTLILSIEAQGWSVADVVQKILVAYAAEPRGSFEAFVAQVVAASQRRA
ncbi:Aste57867_18634 [Aphanomyces stellatus]|uniref:Aste57867_18634 protein n=1 Tax=Aphanomyces stellatus TaxID=120398 RepID=A0A485LB01_9STRA|nr:hypothetical protein As57867_018572 [Aphanomyces stellatus]VFT95369.1 Aste57867_18634 [Aphanomyces stellatus]